MAAAVWGAISLSVWLLSTVAGQRSSVVCLANYKWAENSRGQNPCLMSAYAAGACKETPFGIDSLLPGQEYTGPQPKGAPKQAADICQCSTVLYTLVSACADCQGATWETWTGWSRNCTSDLVSIAQFPDGVPPGTSFPAWAYVDPSLPDTYQPDVARAYAAQGLPESSATTPSASSTSSIPVAVQSVSIAASTPTGTPQVTQDNTIPQPNLAPIIGGTVGGLAVVTLFFGLILFIRSRIIRKASHEPGTFSNEPLRPNSSYFIPSPPLIPSPPPIPISYGPPAYDPNTICRPQLQEKSRAFNPPEPPRPSGPPQVTMPPQVPMSVSPNRGTARVAARPIPKHLM